MALLDKLRRQNKSLIVVHVNYEMRKSAYRDQEIVERYCRDHDIVCVVMVAPQKPEGNFQAFSRSVRLNKFIEVANAYGAQDIVLAHHKDDQLETIVFELLSKRKPEYLGIRRVQKFKSFRIIRPLLDCSKQDLIEYCDRHQIEYGVDETNLEYKYKRNQIRHVLKEMSDEDKETLFLYQRYYNREKRRDALCNRLWLGRLDSLDLNRYRLVSAQRRLGLLRLYLKKQGVDIYDYSEPYLKSIDERLMSGNHQTIDLKSHNLYIQYGKAWCSRHKNYEFSVKFDRIAYTAHSFFSLRKKGPPTSGVTLTEADFPITVRNARAGDKIKLRYGTKKVSRFFIDRKIDEESRRSWPVVENVHGDIVLVVGLGCDVNHYSEQPNLFVLR